MADAKWSDDTAFPPNASPALTDYVMFLEDPGGTPANSKSLLSDILATLVSTGLGLEDLPAATSPDTDDETVIIEDGVPSLATPTQVRTQLSLVPGTDVQAYNANLAALAGLTSAADRLPYFTGSGTAALATFTTAGRNLVDDADATAQRTTLGLGSIATQAANSVSITGGSITGITDLAVADGGTGASDASGARTNLGLGTISTAAATDYAKLAFGGTAQVFTNTEGAHIDIAREAFAGVLINLYQNNSDTQPVLALQASGLGASFAGINLGPGGSTGTDTKVARARPGVLSFPTPNASTSSRPITRLTVVTTAVGNVGTGEDTLQSYSIPGAVQATDGDQVRMIAYGTFANNGNAKTLRTKYGTVTIASATLPTSVAGSWRAETIVTRTGSATQDIQSTIIYNAACVTTFATGSRTMSSAQTIACTGEATSDNDVVSEQMSVDFLPG